MKRKTDAEKIRDFADKIVELIIESPITRGQAREFMYVIVGQLDLIRKTCEEYE